MSTCASARETAVADSPPSTMMSSKSALWTIAMARIFSAWASRETPRSACLSVETRTYPSVFIRYMLWNDRTGFKSILTLGTRSDSVGADVTHSSHAQRDVPKAAPLIVGGLSNLSMKVRSMGLPDRLLA